MWTLAAWVALPALAGWVRLDTERFTVYGDGPVAARTAAVRLEQFHSALTQAYAAQLPGQPARKITVMAFEEVRGLRPHAPLDEDGRKRPLAGVFLRRPGGSLIALAIEYQGGVVEHEYVHQVLSSPQTPVPAWFSEGLAEYYSTLQPLGSTKVRIGDPELYWLDILRSRRWIPVERLLAVTHVDDEYTNPALSELFYAQSWLLVHWCMADPENQRPAQLARLLESRDAGTPPEQAIGAAFGLTPAALMDALNTYADGVTMPTRVIPLPLGLPKVKAKAVPIPDSERDAVLGWLDAWTGRLDNATPLLEAAVRDDPHAAVAWDGMGLLAQGRGQMDAARDAWAKAIALGSTDPGVHFAYAWAAAGSEPADPEIIPAFTRSVELDPTVIEAYPELVDRSLAAGATAAADEWLQKGLAADPYHPDLRFRLAQAHLRRGKPEFARTVLDRLLAGALDGELRAQAEALRSTLSPLGTPAAAP